MDSLESRRLLAIGGDVQLVSYDLESGHESFLDVAEFGAPIQVAEDGSSLYGAPGFEPVGPFPYHLPMASSNLPDEIIFGADDRRIVLRPRDLPYRRTGFLRLKRADGTWEGCSGMLVGPFHFLTAASCVHTGTSNGSWISEGHVTMARDGKSRFYGSATVTNAYAPGGWLNNGDYDYDWAIATLDRNIGNVTGWNGWWWYPGTSSLTGKYVHLNSYPADLASHWADPETDGIGAEMYNAQGNLLAPWTYQLNYWDKLDTVASGMTGGAVIEDKGGSTGWVALGVHSGSNSSYNQATRITESVSNSIQSLRDNLTAPIDRPDLVSYDEWFHSNESQISTPAVEVGDAFSARVFLRNNGTASSGSFTVSFYASTNPIITTADFFLGSMSVNSLSPMNFREVNFSLDSFPNIPAYNYYFGWIIDSENTVTEYLEDNNMGYVTDNMLAVFPPDDHGDDASTATTLNLPTSGLIDGSIEFFTDEDWFKIDSVKGAYYSASALIKTTQFLYLTVYDQDGTTVLSEDIAAGSGDFAFASWSAAADGYYYIKVSAPLNDAGEYTFNAGVSDFHGNTLNAARSVDVPDTYSGIIEYVSDVDWFSFTAFQNRDYRFRILHENLGASKLTLVDRFGSEIETVSSVGNQSEITWTAPETGRVYLEVDNQLDERGSYFLELDDISPAPTVHEVIVNDGTVGRSNITSIDVVFSEVLYHFFEDAFTVQRIDDGTEVGTLNVERLGIDGKSMARLTFAGHSTDTRTGSGSGNSLADGRYRILIDRTKVQAFRGHRLTMENDYVYGDATDEALYRIFGDTDGDGDVDGQDYGQFGLTFLKQSADAQFNPLFDFDGDGDVDGQDYGQFGLRFLKKI